MKKKKLIDENYERELKKIRREKRESDIKNNKAKKKKPHFLRDKNWVDKYNNLLVDPAKITTRRSSNNFINCYYDPLKRMSQYVHTQFALGIPSKRARLLNLLYLQHINGFNDGIPVVNGKRAVELVLNRAQEIKRDYIYIDHAYFFRGYALENKAQDDIYFRVIINAVHANKIKRYPMDRFKLYNLKIKPWKTTGSHVLVCPPTGYLESMIGLSPTWLEDTVEEIRKNTDRPILIRPKPGLKIFEKYGLIAKKYKKIKIIEDSWKRPISSDLKNCWATVAPASGVSIESILHGIPTFSHKLGPAASVAETDYSKIETPIRPEREPLLASLAYSQFSSKELSNGYAFEVLKEKYPRVLKGIR